MAKSNGGIIGPDNIPTGPLAPASGVWRLKDAFKYQSEGLWPVVTGITYPVANSIRYDKTTSQYLRRTCGSSASSYTLSLWVKNCEPPGGSTTAIYWNGAGAKINWECNDFSQIYWYDPLTRTTGFYRDVGAWYHLVWKVSSNVGTLYVNGSAAPGLTSVSGIDSLNSGNYIYLGIDAGVAGPQNGYFAEVCFIDGTALDPTSFGEYDEDSGIWKPIDVSGLSFGSNGFYLDFKDSSALGNDVSGNNNDLTSSGFTSLNQSTDTPTNNFCTLNPLQSNNAKDSVIAPSNGNLTFNDTNNSDWRTMIGSLGISSGKWYWEVKATSLSGSGMIGVGRQDYLPTTLNKTSSAYPGSNSGDYSFSYRENGTYYYNGTSSGSHTTFSAGDIIMIAFDMDNGAIYTGKNGTWNDSGDPTSGASKTGASYTGIQTGEFYNPSVSASASNAQLNHNFGNPPYAANGYTDGNGFGDFSYAVPTGYYALNTQNINVQG